MKSAFPCLILSPQNMYILYPQFAEFVGRPTQDSHKIQLKSITRSGHISHYKRVKEQTKNNAQSNSGELKERVWMKWILT